MKKNNIIWYDTCLRDTGRKATYKNVLSYLNPLSATPLSCISMNNQECKARPEIIYVNSDEPVF